MVTALGFVVLPMIWGVLFGWLTVAQFRFVNAYRTRHMEELLTSSDHGDRLLARADWWSSSSLPLIRRGLRLYRTPQPEAELERLRKSVIMRWVLALMLSLSAGILWVVLASIVD